MMFCSDHAFGYGNGDDARFVLWLRLSVFPFSHPPLPLAVSDAGFVTLAIT
jgi:hypothetical protein